MRFPIRSLVSGSAALLVLSVGGPVSAQDGRHFGDRPWEIGLFSGIGDDRPEFETDAVRFAVAHEGLLGVRLARHLRAGPFLEGQLVYLPMELAFDGEDGRERHELRALLFSAGPGVALRPLDRLQLLARAGLGGVRWNGRGAAEIDVAVDLGLGIRVFIAPDIAVRTEARWGFVPSALKAVRSQMKPDLGPSTEGLWLLQLSGGISFFLGNR